MASTFQLYPPVSASVSLTGDVITSGNVATVVGIQTTPVDSTTPTDGQILEFDGGTGKWVPTDLSVAPGCILVNGETVSADALILVDTAFALAPDDLNVLVNGV